MRIANCSTGPLGPGKKWGEKGGREGENERGTKDKEENAKGGERDLHYLRQDSTHVPLALPCVSRKPYHTSLVQGETVCGHVPRGACFTLSIESPALEI